MDFVERIVRRVADRPRTAPDYDLIERDLDIERRAEERAARQREARERCAREGHLESSDDGCEITSWESATPIRRVPGCPRCGEPVGDSAGLL